MFDFTVNSGNLTVSSLAAYDPSNLRLQQYQENRLVNGDQSISIGEVIYDPSVRPNETDLYGKYKGIPRNQSAQIDAALNYVIYDNTPNGDLHFKQVDAFYPKGVSGSRQRIKSHINPLHDNSNGIYYATPSGLHKFTYQHTDNRIWRFDAFHLNTSRATRNDSYTENHVNVMNGKISKDVLTEARNYIQGDPENNPNPCGLRNFENQLYEQHGNSPEPEAVSLGNWGAPVRYTITVHNAGSNRRTVALKILNTVHIVYAFRETANADYQTEIYSSWIEHPANPVAPNFANVTIPAGETKTFEVVLLTTLNGAGVESRLILGDV
jgi:hypothetical protein